MRTLRDEGIAFILHALCFSESSDGIRVISLLKANAREVVDRFRATGEGWQTRVDAALQDWLKKHKPAA